LLRRPARQDRTALGGAHQVLQALPAGGLGVQLCTEALLGLSAAP
jgi:hypothetical protein